MGASPSAQTEGGAPALLWKSIQNSLSAPVSYTHLDVYKRQLIVRRPIILYFAVFRLVAILSQYTINHLTQLIGRKRFCTGKSHVIHIQSEFATALFCQIRDF